LVSSEHHSSIQIGCFNICRMQNMTYVPCSPVFQPSVWALPLSRSCSNDTCTMHFPLSLPIYMIVTLSYRVSQIDSSSIEYYILSNRAKWQYHTKLWLHWFIFDQFQSYLCFQWKLNSLPFFFFFPDGTQGLTLARQALYHLSHSTSPLY
jgi:hypothetical protein